MMETTKICCNIIFMKVETAVLLMVNIKILVLWDVMLYILCIYLYIVYVTMLSVSQTV
jgi:hypothetical protein